MFTTVKDVKDRWLLPDPVPVADPTLEKLVADAEDTIAASVPGIAEKVAAETVPKARVVKIVSRMVIRALRNPEGIRTQQETTGPFSGSTTFGGDEPGEIYLSEVDRKELIGAPRRGKAFTVSTIAAGRSCGG